MRNRSPSPLQSYPQQQQKKYYSREEVSQILRAMVESKLSGIYQEVEEKQQMIRTLNDKLNRNDTQLQNATKQIYDLSLQCSQASERQLEGTVDLINRMLNEKLQGYWNVVQT